MPRTTSDAVAEILEVDDDISLTPFIATANSLVTERCVPLGYDDERLELIERWLSAHFYSIRDKVVSSESAKGVSQSYQYAVALGLNVTIYGQQAKLLDTKNGLDTFSKKQAKVSWLGTEPEGCV